MSRRKNELRAADWLEAHGAPRSAALRRERAKWRYGKAPSIEVAIMVAIVAEFVIAHFTGWIR